MPTTCFTPVRGKRIRVTSLDECGNPPEPGTEDSTISTDGFVTLTLSAEVEEGTEILQTKADGSLCVNERAADSFKYFTLEIEFCGVNPSLISMVTNAEPYEDEDGNVIGFTVPEGTLMDKFAFELWTGLAGQACEPGGEEASGYLLLPFVQTGVLGDIEVTGEDAVTFSLTGAFTKGGNAWGDGPYDVRMVDGTPTPLPTPLDPLDHLLMIETMLAPPPDACDPQPMPGIEATGATAGTPGTFTPEGSTAPITAGGMLTLTASPTTAWTEGQYVVSADGDEFYWDGEAWAQGRAPADGLF